MQQPWEYCHTLSHREALPRCVLNLGCQPHPWNVRSLSGPHIWSTCTTCRQRIPPRSHHHFPFCRHDQRHTRSFPQASTRAHMSWYRIERVRHLFAVLRPSTSRRPLQDMRGWRAHFSANVTGVGSAHEVHSTATNIDRASVSPVLDYLSQCSEPILVAWSGSTRLLHLSESSLTIVGPGCVR
jgi:hypothetical protein